MLKYMAVISFGRRSLNVFGTKILFTFHIAWTLIYYKTLIGYGVVHFYQGVYEIEFICEAVIFLGIFLRFMMLLRQRLQFAATLRLCKDLWTSLTMPEKWIVYGFVRKVHRIVYFMLTLLSLCAASYIITSQLAVKSQNKFGNVTRRPLPIKWGLDYQEDPWYWIALVLQTFHMLNTAVIASTVDTLGLFLIMMTCGFLRSLRYRLFTVSKSTNEFDNYGPNTVTGLKACVVFHQKVLK